MLHARGFLQDMRNWAVLLAYAGLVAATGVSLPAFLVDAALTCRTAEEATQCAKHHLKRACKYLGEILRCSQMAESEVSDWSPVSLINGPHTSLSVSWDAV